MERLTTLGIDNGTSEVRAGFWGGEGRIDIMPNVVGRDVKSTADPPEWLVGHDVIDKKYPYVKRRPMEKGVIVNWDHMEMVWRRILTGEHLCADPDLSKYAFVMTDMTFSPKSQREKMTQMMFESFEVPALSILDNALASLGSIQYDTGLVIDMGHASTRVVPVLKGQVLGYGIELDYGGIDIVAYLMQLSETTSWQTAEIMMKKLCYVAKDYEQEMLDAKNNPESVKKTCDLPNYDIATLGFERFQCQEALFNPMLIGKTDPSLPQAIYNVLMQHEPDIRKQLADGILLSGMPSTVLWLDQRLRTEFEKLWPKEESYRIMSPPSSYRAGLLGACYVNPEWEKQKFMTKAQYDEEGPSLVYKFM